MLRRFIFHRRISSSQNPTTAKLKQSCFVSPLSSSINGHLFGRSWSGEGLIGAPKSVGSRISTMI
uniref:Uncharacterized protein n=1 Tax=Helianthus annuus TaxID=4232 RepID=A0A251TTC6_HELAN